MRMMTMRIYLHSHTLPNTHNSLSLSLISMSCSIPNYCCHMTSVQAYVCQKCNSSFLRKSYLLRHMKRHDENAAQPCRYCSKTFRDRSNLIQHLETHRVGKYACTKCEKKFQFQKSLTIHTKLHDKNDNSTKCRICGNVFACEYNLRQHINELHYGFAKYSCDVCGKNFTRKWNRNKHFKKAHPSELFKAKLTGVIS